MALEKLAFGGEEFKYDTLAGISSRFAIGNRDIADVKELTANSLFAEPKSAAVPVPSILSSETAAQAQVLLGENLYTCVVQKLNTVPKCKFLQQAKSPENLLISTKPPKSTADEEQFISVPDSPTAAPAVVSPNTARHVNKTGPEGGAEPGLLAQELPWNQASVNIRSPLLRLHTGMSPWLSCLHAWHRTCYLLVISCDCLLQCRKWCRSCGAFIQAHSVYLFTCSLIHSYIHSFICSIHALNHLFVLLLMQHDCPYSCVMLADWRILVAEIVEFCRFLEPTAEEAAMREAATQRVRQSITEVYASASVQVFGSFVTGQLCILQDAHSALRSCTCRLHCAGTDAACETYTQHNDNTNAL